MVSSRHGDDEEEINDEEHYKYHGRSKTQYMEPKGQMTLGPLEAKQSLDRGKPIIHHIF